MRSKNKHGMVVNAFGILGYVFLALQWMWVLGMVLPAIIRSDLFIFFVPDVLHSSSTPVSHAAAQGNDSVSSLWLIVAVGIAVVVIGLTIIALRRAPKTVGETGQKLTQGAAKRVVPILTHHAPLPPAKQRFLTARIAFDIKLALLIIPVIGAFMFQPAVHGITHEAAMLVEALLASATLLLFCVQVGVAKAVRLDLSRLW